MTDTKNDWERPKTDPTEPGHTGEHRIRFFGDGKWAAYIIAALAAAAVAASLINRFNGNDF